MADTFFIINSIFSIGFLVGALWLTCFHLMGASKSIGDKKLCDKKLVSQYPSLSLSYILMAINILSGLSLTLDSVFTTKLCSGAQYYGPTLYSLFKTNIYLILCCRIYISFKDSVYAYNHKGLIIWCLILITWTLFNVIAGNITVKSQITTGDDENDQDTKCIVEVSFIYIIGQVLLDFISMIVNCILFVRPVCKLYKLTNDNIEIKKVAIKQCILSIIAVISSVIAMIGIGIATFITPTFVSIDMFISSFSVILMYKWNNNLVEKACCCFMPTLKDNKSNQKTTNHPVIRMQSPQDQHTQIPSNTDGQLSMNSQPSQPSDEQSSAISRNNLHSNAVSKTITQTIISADDSTIVYENK